MKSLLSVLCLLLFNPAFSQLYPAKNYPLHYFRNPLNIPIKLAANFGELRVNHYHMGLDIRTEHRENLPVFAAADGYITRVRIEPFGFGQSIYIVHPNGYSSLYAHLNSFSPALAAYVKQQQYKQQSWRISISIPEGMFPVHKGDLIAYSGNTGGSQGPHLHFEIRRTADDVNLNPLLFDLPVPDNLPPTITRLALYDLNRSIYEQAPVLYPVRKKGYALSLSSGVIVTHSTHPGFAIQGFDTQSGSSNPNGIYESVLYDNGKALIGFQMDAISYDYTLGLNAHIDYKTHATGGPWLQQLFRLPGYTHSIYTVFNNKGRINLEDGKVHDIRIEVLDANGNRNQISFKLQYRPGTLPVVAGSGKMFYPMMPEGMESRECAFYIGEKCLYDSVHLALKTDVSTVPEAASNLQHIGERYIPLADSFLVRISPSRPVDQSLRPKLLMKWVGKNEEELRNVDWQAGWASAYWRNFGTFQLVIDTIPPQIVPVGFTDGANLSAASKLVIQVKDNQKQIKTFRAELDGKWLLFSNDKARNFVYTFDEYCGPGKHSLKIVATDIAGNKAEKLIGFVR